LKNENKQSQKWISKNLHFSIFNFKLFKMDDATFCVSIEACLFDCVVKLFRSVNFFELKFRVGLVSCNQHHRSYTNQTIRKTSI